MMWKRLTMGVLAAAMLVGTAQAARDITSSKDVVQGVPNDGVTTGDNFGWPAAEAPALAVDDNVGTKFLHFKGEIQATGLRITPAVGATAVQGLTFTTANDAAERDPITWELSGSNESIDGPYTLIASGDIVDFAGTTAWARQTKTTTPIPVANTVAYKHYQLMFPTVRTPASANSMQIAEIELLADMLKAFAPKPASGTIGVTMPLLQWTKSDTAVLYDFYLGASPNLTGADRKVTHGTATTQLYYQMGGLEPGITYYWRVDSIDKNGVVYTGDVWEFTMASKAAWAPKPANGAMFVAPDVELSWNIGLDASTHTVFLSEDQAAVEAGAAEALVSKDQFLNTYTPSGLEQGKTYYWRVDEVGIADGSVWSFTVRPTMTITDASLVGWWKMEDTHSDVAADYSGYDNYGTLMNGPMYTDGYLGDALSFDGVDDYVDCGNDTSLDDVESVTVAAWVRPDFTSGDHKIASNENNTTGGYKLAVYTDGKPEMEIRDSANAATLNRTVGGGTVLSTGLWYHVVGVYEKGVALRTYVNGKLDRELVTAAEAGISTGSLMLGRETYSSSNWWLGLMDDVRVYNKALTEDEIQQAMRGDLSMAWDPQPTNGMNMDIRDVSSLEWAAGDTAAQHDVYFGQDKEAIKTADVSSDLYQGRQTGTSFSLSGLVEFGGGDYFWRIDEVEADGVTVHKGATWTFAVPAHLIVDEFESYNDSDNRIFDVWVDGYGDDTNGSVVGYIDSVAGTFGERTIVHGGQQSMPFEYDNTSAAYSQAERTFDSPQNWTASGVSELTVYVYGYPVAGDVAVTETAGKISVTGSGADIWNNHDEFTFAYKTLTGDGSMAARVTSISAGTNTWCKGGVMIRDSINGGATQAIMALTAGGGNGASFQHRDLTNGGSANTDIATAITVPYWVKIERFGTTLTGYTSSDGKNWTMLNSAIIEMTDPVYIGLAVTAHTTAESRTYDFDSISTTGNVTGSWKGAVISASVHNSAQPMYITIEDSTGKKSTVTDPDIVTMTGWNALKIPFSKFSGVSMSKVKKMIIGVGNSGTSGTGMIFIDDIWVTKPETAQ